MLIVKRVLSGVSLLILVLVAPTLISINSFPLYQQVKGQTLSNNNELTSNLPRVYTNKTYGITMNYPDNWLFDCAQGNALLKSVRQNLSSSQNISTLNKFNLLGCIFPINEGIVNKSVAPTILTLAVNDNIRGLSLDKFVNNIIKQQKGNSNTTQIINRTSAIIGGNEAVKLLYDKKDDQNRLTRVMNTIVKHDNKAFFLLLTSPPKGYMKYLQSVEEMEKSFKIK